MVSSDAYGPAQQAIQLIMDLSPASIIIRKESPSPWVISDAPSDHELPTLTSHRRGPVLDNLLNWQIHLADSPRMQEPLLNLIRQGDEDSVFRILDIFDSTDSPRLRNACLEALRLVGGCQVAQQLSARVANIQLYVQCLVLCALEGLACQPYRGPGDDHGESRSQQIETVNTVLRHLLEIPSSADLRDIRDSAVDGVRRHGSQCQSF